VTEETMLVGKARYSPFCWKREATSS